MNKKTLTTLIAAAVVPGGFILLGVYVAMRLVALIKDRSAQ